MAEEKRKSPYRGMVGPLIRTSRESTEQEMLEFKKRIEERLKNAQERLKSKRETQKTDEKFMKEKFSLQLQPSRLSRIAASEETDPLPIAEIGKKVLDQIAKYMIDMAPEETRGVLFGNSTKLAISISDSHILQEVVNRNIMSIEWNPAVIERIKNVQKSFSDLEFLGGFHSHPYFDPSWINGKQDNGLGLSPTDVESFVSALRESIRKKFEESDIHGAPDIEVVVACYPWKLWGVQGKETEWQSVKANIPVIARNINAKSNNDLYVDRGYKIVDVLKKGIDYELKLKDIKSKFYKTMEKLADAGEEECLKRVEKEWELVKNICGERIRGFDVKVVCHCGRFWEEEGLVGLSPISILPL